MFALYFRNTIHARILLRTRYPYFHCHYPPYTQYTIYGLSGLNAPDYNAGSSSGTFEGSEKSLWLFVLAFDLFFGNYMLIPPKLRFRNQYNVMERKP